MYWNYTVLHSKLACIIFSLTWNNRTSITTKVKFNERDVLQWSKKHWTKKIRKNLRQNKNNYFHDTKKVGCKQNKLWFQLIKKFTRTFDHKISLSYLKFDIDNKPNPNSTKQMYSSFQCRKSVKEVTYFSHI